VAEGRHGHRARIKARSHHLRRPLRQQRLAPGAPQTQTKITWDNVLVVGPSTAAKIGYDPDDREKLVNERRTRSPTSRIAA
jgi:hypothetical protein